MESLDPDNFSYHYKPLGEFLAGSVGSPMFYICMAELAVLLCSIVALIVTRKTKKLRDVEGAAPYNAPLEETP